MDPDFKGVDLFVDLLDLELFCEGPHLRSLPRAGLSSESTTTIAKCGPVDPVDRGGLLISILKSL